MDIQALQEEIDHTKKLIKVYLKRLRILEIQAATFGILVPPHIQIEIDTTKENIQKCHFSIDTKNRVLQMHEEINKRLSELQEVNRIIEFIELTIELDTGDMNLDEFKKLLYRSIDERKTLTEFINETKETIKNVLRLLYEIEEE